MNLLVVSSFNYVKNYVTSISIGNVKLLVNSNGPVKNYTCTHNLRESNLLERNHHLHDYNHKFPLQSRG